MFAPPWVTNEELRPGLGRSSLDRTLIVASAAAFEPGNVQKLLHHHPDCKAFAGFSRAARVAGIVVARHVIAVINKVAIVRITGSDARTA
jgi:hypothetical protein